MHDMHHEHVMIPHCNATMCIHISVPNISVRLRHASSLAIVNVLKSSQKLHIDTVHQILGWEELELVVLVFVVWIVFVVIIESARRLFWFVARCEHVLAELIPQLEVQEPLSCFHAS